MLQKDTIKKICREASFNGNVLISNEDEILFYDGFGYKDIKKKEPFHYDTCFRIGSITKQFTAAAILKLVQEGLVSLQDPISKWLETPYEDAITIHHLLSNSSGIPNFPFDGDFDRYLKTDEFHKQMIYNEIFSRELLFKPGERFDYSSSGFLILSYIIEIVSGVSYDRYVTNTFFTPLKMKRTGFHFMDIAIENFSTLYDKQEETIKYSKPYDMRKASGAGGLYSSIGDLSKWGLSLMNHTVLSKELVIKMCSSQTKITEEGGYGYGMIVTKEKNHTLLYHPGNGPGVYAMHMMIDNKYQLILLSNVYDKDSFKTCFDGVFDYLLHQI